VGYERRYLRTAPELSFEVYNRSSIQCAEQRGGNFQEESQLMLRNESNCKVRRYLLAWLDAEIVIQHEIRLLC
jgi:hypothetical protein